MRLFLKSDQHRRVASVASWQWIHPDISDAGDLPEKPLNDREELGSLQVFVSIDGRNVTLCEASVRTGGLLARFSETNPEVECKPIKDEDQSAQAEDEPGGERYVEETVISGVRQG